MFPFVRQNILHSILCSASGQVALFFSNNSALFYDSVVGTSHTVPTNSARPLPARSGIGKSGPMDSFSVGVISESRVLILCKSDLPITMAR